MKGQYMQYSWKLQFYQFRKKTCKIQYVKGFQTYLFSVCFFGTQFFVTDDHSNL